MGLFDGANQKIGVAFCSPHRKLTLPNGQVIVDTITVDWHRARCALSYGTNINYIEFFCDGMEIGVARSRAARRCMQHNPRPLYLMFLDDDVLPNYDAFTKLFFRAQTNPEYDIFCGVYCCKGGNPPDPLIYAGNGAGPFWDWSVGDLLTTEQHGITGIHMGLTLIRTSLFERIVDAGLADLSDGLDEGDDPLFKTVKGSWKTPEGLMQTRSGTEDLFFCQKALNEKVGAKIMVDTSVLAGHIDKQTGITWGLPDNSPPIVRAKWLGGKDQKEAEAEETKCDCVMEGQSGVGVIPEHGYVWIDRRDCDPRRMAREDCQKCNGTGKVKSPLKLALDLGAGGIRRQWPGHKTYTLDGRKDSNPDYCQDIRYLNLPDNHFDLVASSHTFEHVPRFEQEIVWSEAFRVCKPGGQCEIIVPSLEWAAAKISDGQADEHVFNVLYGSQEAAGIERKWNLHYFGYTKSIAKALAEQAGFADVTVKDWRDEKSLAYEMIITGIKPNISKEDLPPITVAKPDE